MYVTNKNIILASGSPRRKQFLTDLNLDFTVSSPDIIEEVLPEEGAMTFCSRMAQEKGAVVSQENLNSWVIAADTVVSLGDKILGKPKDGEEALSTLRLLSGKKHEVITSYSLHYKGVLAELRSILTYVKFIDLTDELCAQYINTGEPFDKAGSYGIQGMASSMVKSIEGSYTNVVGLPMAELVTDLLKYQVISVNSIANENLKI